MKVRIDSLASFFLFGAAPLMAQATVIPLPGTYTGRFVSGDGQFVAGIHDPFSSPATSWLARWSLTGGVDQIARLELDSLGLSYQGNPYGISSDGERILVHLPSLTSLAGVWHPSSGLAGLPEYPGASATFGWRMSGDGNTVLGFTTAPRFAVSWTGLGAPAPLCGTMCDFVARAVSEDGLSVVGELHGNPMNLPAGVYHWRAGVGFTPLGAGVSVQSFLDLSADGTTVVGNQGVAEIFRWTAATGAVSIPPPAGWDRVRYPKVNATGDRIVAQFESSGGQPFSRGGGIWESATGWVTLQSYMASRGATGFSDSAISVQPIDFADEGNAVLAYVRYPGAPFFFNASMLYFDQPVPGTIGGGYCGPQPIGVGTTASTLVATGSPVVTVNDVKLGCTGIPSGAVGYVLSSRGQGMISQPGRALGTLCLGGGSSIGRHNRPGEVAVAGVPGRLDFTLDLTDFPTPMGSIAVQPGETWNFQVWHRDGNASNFTPAVSVLMQ